jgi:hypothetical protein
MNKPITLKITLALFFVIICQLTLRAQDTTKKMILVVRPGQTNTPASTNPANSSTPGQATTVVVPDNTVPMPVRTSPMEHPVVKMTSLPIKPSSGDNAANGKKGTVITPAIPTKVAATVSPAMAPPVKVSPSINLGGGSSGPANSAPGKTASTTIKTNAAGYTAPTTAERSVTPSLVPRKATPPIMVPVKPSELKAMNANKANTPANGGASAPATTAAVVTPVVVPVIAAPAKKDAVAVVTKKDSLIAKKDSVAKKDSLLAKADSSKKDTSKTDTIGFQKQRIVFLEIGGPGLAISANYDMRIQIGQSNKLFGFRVGAGYFQSGNNWVFTVPLQANYLYGKDGKFLEFGLGTTFLISRGDNYSSKNFIFDNDTGFIATGTIGVRYAPSNSHVNFRLAYVPIIDSDGLVNIGGFSVGYTF